MQLVYVFLFYVDIVNQSILKLKNQSIWDKVFELLGNSTGIDLCDDLANQVYPMPTSFIGDELTHVGRVRKDLYKDNALSLWITGDQLMKGAAYNSVDIGLKMIELGLLK